MTAVNLNRAVRGPVTAVPVVAGKGVRLVADTVNNGFFVEADETVLYEGTFTHQTFPDITLSESYTNFEKLEITLGGGHDTNYPRPFYTFTCYTSDLTNEGYLGFTTFSYATSDASSVYPHCIRYSVSNSDTTKLSHNAQGMYKQTCASSPGMSSGRYNTAAAYEYGITRVVGINRISST